MHLLLLLGVFSGKMSSRGGDGASLSTFTRHADSSSTATARIGLKASSTAAATAAPPLLTLLLLLLQCVYLSVSSLPPPSTFSWIFCIWGRCSKEAARNSSPTSFFLFPSADTSSLLLSACEERASDSGVHTPQSHLNRTHPSRTLSSKNNQTIQQVTAPFPPTERIHFSQKTLCCCASAPKKSSSSSRTFGSFAEHRHNILSPFISLCLSLRCRFICCFFSSIIISLSVRHLPPLLLPSTKTASSCTNSSSSSSLCSCCSQLLLPRAR